MFPNKIHKKIKIVGLLSIAIAVCYYIYIFARPTVEPDNNYNYIQSNEFSVLYLIQGKSFFNLPKWYYLFYADNSNNDALIFLYYDEKIYHSEIDNVTELISINNYNLHIIYDPNSTFWVGRNELLFEGLKYEYIVKHTFDYFAFLDEDLLLFQLNNFERDSNKIILDTNVMKNTLHHFYTEFLKKYRPIIGIANRMKHVIWKKYEQNKDGEINKFIVGDNFDTMAWWIHRDVISNKLLFPFIDSCDSVNWWYGSRLIKSKFKMLWPINKDYNAQILYSPFFVGNKQHSNYVKQEKTKYFNQCFKVFLNEIQSMNRKHFNNFYQNIIDICLKENKSFDFGGNINKYIANATYIGINNIKTNHHNQQHQNKDFEDDIKQICK